MARARPFSLPIVHAGEELRGVAPPILERAAARCKSADRTHRGIVVTAAAVAGHALATCAPPGASAPLTSALDVALDWVHGRADEAATRKARSDAFAALAAVERRTVEAVRASLERLPREPTPLDAHGDEVVARHAGLGAYYAGGAALLVLDAIGTPSHALVVAQQAAGAMAYHRTGLGPARAPALRARAWEQAAWEAERPGAAPAHGHAGLAVQLFHEFLGAAWKDASDAQRILFGDFVEWALAGSANGI